MSHYDDYCREREEPDEAERADAPTEFPDDPPGKCYAMWRGIHEASELLGNALFDKIPDAKFLAAFKALATAEVQIRAMERALHQIAEWPRFPQPVQTETAAGANLAIECLAAIAREVIGPAVEADDPDSLTPEEAF